LVADEDAVLLIDGHIARREGSELLALLLPAEILHEADQATRLQLPFRDAVVQRVRNEDLAVAIHLKTLRSAQRAITVAFAAKGYAVIEQVAVRTILVHADRAGGEVGDEDNRRTGTNLAKQRLRWIVDRHRQVACCEKAPHHVLHLRHGVDGRVETLQAPVTGIEVVRGFADT